ncbi:MAG: hypothetical protein J7K12_02570 [Thermoplasmata archaeon]|nr:hypothetical protein [Thermoplasmata archaeon]
MNKTVFSITAISILLLLASFIPVGNSIATKENESKTMEVPVRIYTLHGIKEIRKELPVNEAMKLQKWHMK